MRRLRQSLREHALLLGLFLRLFLRGLSLLRVLRAHALAVTLHAGRDNGDGHGILLGVRVVRAEDDVRVVAGQLLNIRRRVVHLEQSDIAGHIDDAVRRTLDRGLEQRAGDGGLRSLHGLIVAAGTADTDMGDALILHHGLNVREVAVDQRRAVNDIRDALDRLLQDLVRLLQGVGHGRAAIHELQKLIVRNHDQRIHDLLQLIDAGQRVIHAGLRLETERLRHDADGQDAQILRELRDDGGRAGAGAAAHTAGHDDHVSVFDQFLDLVRVFIRGLLSDLRLRARAAAAGDTLTDLDGLGSLAELQGLLIRINTDKINSDNIFIDHAGNRVITRTADADHNDLRGLFGLVKLDL